jgi:hypothetical protein
LREAIVEFEKESATPALASAFVELSHALLLQAKLDEARKTIHQAADLSKGSPDPALTLPLAIEEARFEIATAAPGAAGRAALAAARHQIESVISTAKKLGYHTIECEGRLLLAELDRKTNPSSAGAHLTGLELETRDRGLLLLSRKAAALNSPALANR